MPSPLDAMPQPVLWVSGDDAVDVRVVGQSSSVKCSAIMRATVRRAVHGA